MLAELAAANAAFAIIKQFAMNGRELTGAGKAINDYVTAKDLLAKKHTKKKSSLFSKATGKRSSDFEEFMALEELKRKEDELREAMQLYGRAGLWNDWVKFQAQARKARQEDLERRIKERKELIDNLAIALLVIATASSICLFVYWVLYLKWL